MAKAMPTALGTCEAIVLVCGGVQASRLPHTLCRPWATGSWDEAQKLSRVSKAGVLAGSLRNRAIISAPER